MTDWKQIFSKKILDRGKAYWRSGCVTEISKKGDLYTAVVKGSRSYRVTVRMRPDGVPSGVGCTCPYAKEDFCKHEAALLFALEEERKQESVPAAPVKPVKVPVPAAVPAEEAFRMPAGIYRYFDVESIAAGVAYTSVQLAKAQELMKHASVDTFGRHRCEEGEEDRFTFRVRLSANGYEGATICFTRDRLVSVFCGWYSCSDSWKEIPMPKDGKKAVCEHILAALLLLKETVLEKELYDGTDAESRKFLEEVKRQSLVRASEQKRKESGKEGTIELLPRVVVEGNSAKLSFRIRKNKPYIVKNISELLKAVSEGGSLTLGKKETIDFSTDGLNAQSLKYAAVLEKAEREKKNFAKQLWAEYGYVLPREIKQTVPLEDSLLDCFFDAANGDTVEYFGTDGGRRRSARADEYVSVPVTEGGLSLEIRLEPVYYKGEVDGLVAKGKVPATFAGENARYVINDRQFMRIASGEKKGGLLLDFPAEGDVLFRVSRRKIPDFYRYVLPELKREMKVIEPESAALSSLVPPDAAIRFYLDAEAENVTCRVVAEYGEESFSCADVLSMAVRQDSVRDAEKEAAAVSAVMKYFPETDPVEKQFFCSREDERLFDFFTTGIEELSALGEINSTARFDALRIKRRMNLKVGVSAGEGINMMGLEITSDISREELLEVLKSYRQKKRFHRLRTGEYVDLDESVAELNALFEGMHLSPKEFVKGKMHIPMYRAVYLDKMLEGSEQIYAERDRTFKKLVKDFKTIGDSDFEVSEQYRGVMRDYQKFGYKWLRTLDAYGFGGILADEMGLGKTLQAISVIADKKKEREEGTAGLAGDVTGTTLVVCPASLVYNWISELERFAPQLLAKAVAGSPEERRETIARYRDYDVLVTSYDYLKRDVADYEGQKYAMEIIDEAQYIKTPSTAAAKSVKIISAATKYALTGTPIENRLSELWSIFDYLMPGYLFAYEAFRSELETPIAKDGDEEASERLKRMTAPFILRRLKKDVLKDLPEKIEEVRYTVLEERQRTLYDSHVAKMQVLLSKTSEEDFNKKKIQVLAELTKIRQVCCDPALLYENYAGGSAKREACLDLIRSAADSGHKMLVFSQFKSMLELLKEDLRKEKISFYEITGDTPKLERVEQASRFNKDDVPVFLISLKAGGTGLNLTGADIVIHYDPWWNVAAQNQATDRAHRIGQKNVVTVYRLIARETVEERILKMQETKRDLAEAVLGGETGGLAGLTREELLQLVMG